MKNKLTSTAIMACMAATLVFATIARADAPDTSTPKKAAVAFAKAVETGDMETAKKLGSGTDAEWNLVKMLSDSMVAMKGFAAAAADKFGDQGKLPEGMAPNLSSDFDSSDEKIDGDTATLVSKAKPDDKFPPTLKKTATGWVMDLSNMDKDPSAAQMAQVMPAMIKSLNAVAANVKAGKYQSMEEAMAALNQLMSAAMGAPGAAGAGPQ